MQSIIKHAQESLEPFRDSTRGTPDPSFTLQLPDEVFTGSNLYAIQKSFDGEFQFDVFFESKSAKQALSASTLNSGITSLKDKFSLRYDEKFPLPNEYKSLKGFSQTLTSSLLGGVGYFYGASIVDPGFAHEWDEDEEEGAPASTGVKVVEPKGLLTATPSRSFFPRGFYWCD